LAPAELPETADAEPTLVVPTAVPPAPLAVEPTASVTPPPVDAAEPTLIVPGPGGEAPPASVHCPKLGFEDDPSSPCGRPARLPRCFAAAPPLPLSLAQQRDLCLSDQFSTCPRLTTAGPARPASDGEPRIVRLPLVPRARDNTPGGAAPEPRPLRPMTPPATDPEQSPRPPTMSAPAPLRARLDRAAAAVAAARMATPVASVEAPEPEPVTEIRKEPPPRVPPDTHGGLAGLPGERRIGPIPVAALPVIGV